ncbi:hypothetical protein cypCar_00020747 [Cyprinus carpio]|nr:hypothetical protein cypCar_00020747 [Cyprinus carpio]
MQSGLYPKIEKPGSVPKYGRIRHSGRLAVHCLRPLQDCDEGRGHGHCGNRRMQSGDVDINTKCMMGGGSCDKAGKETPFNTFSTIAPFEGSLPNRTSERKVRELWPHYESLPI